MDQFESIRRRLDALETARKIPELLFPEYDRELVQSKTLLDHCEATNQKLRAQNLAFREAMAFAYSRIGEGQSYHARIHLETVIRDNPEL